jgi:hypothetical protein
MTQLNLANTSDFNSTIEFHAVFARHETDFGQKLLGDRDTLRHSHASHALANGAL